MALYHRMLVRWWSSVWIFTRNEGVAAYHTINGVSYILSVAVQALPIMRVYSHNTVVVSQVFTDEHDTKMVPTNFNCAILFKKMSPVKQLIFEYGEDHASLKSHGE